MPEIYRLDEELWNRAMGKAVPIFEVGDIQVGIAVIPPGVRLPEEGYSVHEESDEFAYIVSGEVMLYTEDESIKLSEGDIMYNERGTPHYTINLSDKPARILWILSPPIKF